jgi:cysteine-rich repeat protein
VVRRQGLAALLVGILMVFHGAGVVRGATITVVNQDGPDEGFNDPTAVVPVGGNPGFTLGEQRLSAFEHAAAIWSDILKSNVEIAVGANFNPLTCDASSAVLGLAGPETAHRDFVNAPVPATWYPQALANSLAGVDLDPASNDIFMAFNSALGTTCSFPKAWYYGLDGGAAEDEIDLVTVVLHELAHGVGFLTYVGISSGTKLGGADDTYMLNLEDHSTGMLYPDMSDQERRTANTATGDLHWVGPAVVAGGGGLAGGRDPVSGHVEMYAPDPVKPGSSVYHFSTALEPDEVMEPFYTGPRHDVGLAGQLMVDLGWPLNSCGNGVLDAEEGCDDGNDIVGDGCSFCTVDFCFACTGEPSVCGPDNGASCDDGDECTSGDACLDGACVGNPDTGTSCNDESPCTHDDACQAGVCVGSPTPFGGCLTAVEPRTGLLVLKDKTPHERDRLTWRWVRGEATSTFDLGTPTASTGYLLCVYETLPAGSTVIMTHEIPAGDNWRPISRGFKYKDRTASSDGIAAVLLKEGDAGRAKIFVKGKGAHLGMTDLQSLDLPVTIQLSNDRQCWQASYETMVFRNTAEVFKAKAD